MNLYLAATGIDIFTRTLNAFDKECMQNLEGVTRFLLIIKNR